MADLQKLLEERRRNQGIGERPPKPLAAVIKVPPPLSEEQIARMKVEQAKRLVRERHEHSIWRSEQWEKFVTNRGKRYCDCTLDKFVIEHDGQREAVKLLTDYTERIVDRIAAGQSILWIGPAGAGKDFLQAAMVREAIKVDKTVQWRNGMSLYRTLRDSIDSRGTSEADIVNPLVRCHVLALSDPVPPTGVLTVYQRSMLFSVIDERYSDLRPTWVTLNVADRREAEDRISVQTVDRLAHDALVITCNWPSWRQRKTATPDQHPKAAAGRAEPKAGSR